MTKGVGKTGKGKNKGKGYGKNGVYGIDGEDDAWEGDPVAWAAAATADAEWARESEGVGTVYDQDECYDEFCGCVTCDIDAEDVRDVSTSEFVSGDFVFGIDVLSDSELTSLLTSTEACVMSMAGSAKISGEAAPLQPQDA